MVDFAAYLRYNTRIVKQDKQMNERIKELIAQCMAEKNLSIKSIDGWHYTGMAKVLDPDKFAELIIEEIHEFITEEIGNDNGVPFLANVKTHFGVE
jgi:hypothetical protein